MTNPKYSGTTSTFDVSLLRADTTAVFDRKIGISGVPITPGSISNIALYPKLENSVQSKAKIMEYILTFLPKNSLSQGTVITIQFPTTFTLLTGTNAFFYIVSGLDDISEQSPVGMSLSGTILTISNFKAIDTPKLITLFLRMTNPSNVGQTTPFQIRTYTDPLKIKLIDQDITTAFTNIDSSSTQKKLILLSRLWCQSWFYHSIVHHQLPSIIHRILCDSIDQCSRQRVYHN
jgi:hypothetical protein